jgi:adenosine deaminase
MCPISNSYVSDGTKADAIKTMLDKRILVTVNSDDPAYFPGYMTENLVTAQQEASLTGEEIVQLVRNAFTASWLDDEEKARYLEQVDEVAGAM